jgi:peptidyl-prolyl cis-trans isomerase C
MNKIITCLLFFIHSPLVWSDVAKVNGEIIEDRFLEFIVDEVEKQGREINKDMRNNIVDRLIDLKVINQAAKKSGLLDDPKILTRAQLSTQELIYTLFLQDYIIKNPVNDKNIEDEYSKFKKTFSEKEYLASHILLKTKNEAEDVLHNLQEDSDFVMLAKSKSIDHETKDNGGSLGWFRKSDMLAPIFNQVSKMSKGDITKTPLQTKFGWHIIKVLDSRKAEPPSFEEIKDELKTDLQKAKLKKYLDDLRVKAKIEIN